jgi:hypothetical protein
VLVQRRRWETSIGTGMRPARRNVVISTTKPITPRPAAHLVRPPLSCSTRQSGRPITQSRSIMYRSLSRTAWFTAEICALSWPHCARGLRRTLKVDAALIEPKRRVPVGHQRHINQQPVAHRSIPKCQIEKARRITRRNQADQAGSGYCRSKDQEHVVDLGRFHDEGEVLIALIIGCRAAGAAGAGRRNDAVGPVIKTGRFKGRPQLVTGLHRQLAEASPLWRAKFHRRADGSTRQEGGVFEFTAWSSSITCELSK